MSIKSSSTLTRGFHPPPKSQRAAEKKRKNRMMTQWNAHHAIRSFTFSLLLILSFFFCASTHLIVSLSLYIAFGESNLFSSPFCAYMHILVIILHETKYLNISCPAKEKIYPALVATTWLAARIGANRQQVNRVEFSNSFSSCKDDSVNLWRSWNGGRGVWRTGGQVFCIIHPCRVSFFLLLIMKKERRRDLH